MEKNQFPALCRKLLEQSSIKLNVALKLTRAWEAVEVESHTMSSHANQDVNCVLSSHAPKSRSGPARSAPPCPGPRLSQLVRTNHRDHAVDQPQGLCFNCGRWGHISHDPLCPANGIKCSTAKGSVILRVIVASAADVSHRSAVRLGNMRTTSRSMTSLTTSKMTHSTCLLLLVPMELFVSTFTRDRHRRQP